MSEEIKPGYYRARAIIGTEQFGWSSKGGKQISFELMLLDIEQRVTTILSFGGNGEAPSLERLKACGWKGGEDTEGLDANEVQVEISYSPDKEGKLRMSAEIKTRGRFKFQKPMSEREVKGFWADAAKAAKAIDAAPNGPSGGGAKSYPTNWDMESEPVDLG